MSKRAPLRPRSKRKVKVKHPLTEQDLQAYLEDGYTPTRIAKECGVGLTVINEKMKKYGMKGRSKPKKVVKKRGKAGPTNKQKPRGRSVKRKPPARKKQNKKEAETVKEDLNNVGTQVISDSTEEADSVHSLLDFMGFNVDKSFVEDQLHKWKTVEGPSPKKGQNAEKAGERSQEKEDGSAEDEGDSSQGVISEVGVAMVIQPAEHEPKEHGDDGSQGTTSEGGVAMVTKPTSEVSSKEKVAGETSGTGDEKVTDASQEDILNEGVEKGADDTDNKDEAIQEEPEKKRGRGRPKRKCRVESLETKPAKRPRRRTRNTKKKDEDGDTGGNDENNGMGENDKEEDTSDNNADEVGKKKKRRRKRGAKRKTETKEDTSDKKAGRPRLTLTKENLQLCVDNGLTSARIAEIFGAGVQSVKRYLRMYKMRKKDRVSSITDEELDKIVLEMCKAHPEWGQVHIQEELQRKGFHLRRAQVRGSVRRVDPVGIEVRKLKNLKMRWNRGSMNKLDKILPADGINMTSKESFISKPPRNGLNALNDEESVRILASVVATTKKTHIETISKEILKQSRKSENKDDALESNGEQTSDGSDPQVVAAVAAIEAENEDKKEETGNKENIATENSKQPDSNTSFPQMSEEDEEYRKRFHRMIMFYEKYRKESSPETNKAIVDISKEDLEECVRLGYSTTRIADKFGTSKMNVNRLLLKYKFGKANRFENISDEALDQIVVDVINEFSIKKGSDVYSYVKQKGYQVRRVDINKSLSRLYPKGLHRKSSSIVQQSWVAASSSNPVEILGVCTPLQGEALKIVTGVETVVLECNTTQEQGQTVELGNGSGPIVMEHPTGEEQQSTVEPGSGGQTVVMECPTGQDPMHLVQTAHGGETVVVLNSEELAQLIQGEGNIVIEYETGADLVEPGVSQQVQQELGVATSPQKVYVTAEDLQEGEKT